MTSEWGKGENNTIRRDAPARGRGTRLAHPGDGGEDFEPEPIPVNLVHREDRLPQAKVESFIAFAARRLRQALKAGVG